MIGPRRDCDEQVQRVVERPFVSMRAIVDNPTPSVQARATVARG